MKKGRWVVLFDESHGTLLVTQVEALRSTINPEGKRRVFYGMLTFAPTQVRLLSPKVVNHLKVLDLEIAEINKRRQRLLARTYKGSQRVRGTQIDTWGDA